jgi:hypothetical protein
MIAERVTKFRRWMRENSLTLASTNGQLPSDLVYRLEGFFAELD